MAWSTAGFDGTVSESAWCRLQRLAGVTECVSAATDMAVTGSTTTRAVNVAAGTHYADGVSATQDAVTSVSIAANVGSAARWDTIAIRRDWGANTATFVAYTGGTTAVPVGTLQNTPGTVTERVLYLVQVPVGANTLTGATVVDRRKWHPGLTVAALAPEFPTVHSLWMTPAEGVLSRWTGSAWVNVTDPPWTAMTLTSGLTSAVLPIRARVVGGQVKLRGQITRTGATAWPAGFTANLFTLPVGMRPGELERVAVARGATSQSGGSGFVEVATGGGVRAFAPDTVTTAFFLSGVSFPRGA